MLAYAEASPLPTFRNEKSVPDGGRAIACPARHCTLGSATTCLTVIPPAHSHR